MDSKWMSSAQSYSKRGNMLNFSTLLSVASMGRALTILELVVDLPPS
jgi:hypothetical protein